MSDKIITEFQIEQKKRQKEIDNLFKSGLQTNPIMQEMLNYNESKSKTKFKLKDLFR